MPRPTSGDGAGILIQVPDRVPARRWSSFELPAAGAYAVGLGFLPADPTDAEKAQSAIEAIVAEEGLAVLGWRDGADQPRLPGQDGRAR